MRFPFFIWLLIFPAIVAQATHRSPSIYLEMTGETECPRALADEYPVQFIDPQSIWGIFPEDRPLVIGLWNLLVHLERKEALYFYRTAPAPFRILNLMAGDGLENCMLLSFFSSGQFLHAGDPVSIDSVEPDFDKHIKGQTLQSFLLSSRSHKVPHMASLLNSVHYVFGNPQSEYIFTRLSPRYEFILVRGLQFAHPAGTSPILWGKILSRAIDRMTTEARLLVIYPISSEGPMVREILALSGAEIVSEGVALQSARGVEHYALAKKIPRYRRHP